MKLLYTRLCRALITLAFITSLNISVKAQPTVLVAGDIAFTGYMSGSATDDFSFVLLKAVNAGTVINFTANGWLNPGVFRAGEENITLTTVAMPAGREIKISALVATQAGNGTSAGTITGVALNLTTVGDQVIAFQGTIPAPVFISAIHMNQYSVDVFECANTTAAVWDPDCLDGSGGTVGNGSFSKIPTGLVTGTNAIWIGTAGDNTSNFDNARFTNCGASMSTAALARAAINNQANWTLKSNGVPAFGLPSGCVFMGLAPLPVNLVSFTGKLNSDKTVTLQWKVEGQQDIQEYIVEESSNGSDFSQLGVVPAGTGTVSTYSYIDMQVATGNNYYRLKTVELSGKIAYSNVVLVNLKAGIKVNVYPNPVTDRLTIQQFGTMQNKTAVLFDGKGNMLQQIRLTNLEQQVNMGRYPAGIYILKMEDGAAFKVVKQ